MEARLCKACCHDALFQYSDDPNGGCSIILSALAGESPIQWSAVLYSDGIAGWSCTQFESIGAKLSKEEK